MRNIKNLVLNIVFVFAFSVGFAQTYNKVKLATEINQNYFIDLQSNFTSIMIRIENNSTFENSYIIANNDTIFLEQNNHNNAENQKGSKLYLFQTKVNSLTLFSGNIHGNNELHLYNAESTETVPTNEARISANNCSEPSSVSQSTWRNGLANPIGVRISTPTNHIIIHHSADNNTVLNDYTTLVRNIYLLHTKTNGFDDIGYNYLIAPDGTIFKGRDPQGLATQDNVQAAHMCNKNENTMGVCMLGTFTSQLPTAAALKSLYSLGAWKVNQDNLNIYGSTMHAIGPTGSGIPNRLLSNVAGHRDGCSPNYTECPGTDFYNTFSQVKDIINVYKTKCLSTGFYNELEKFKLLELDNQIFQIPAIQYKTIKIVNVNGNVLFEDEFLNNITNFSIPKNEMIIISLIAENDVYTIKYVRK